MRVNLKIIVVTSALTLACPALAKDKAPPAPPKAWQDLTKCKEIADPSARLACYDSQVAKLDQAAAAGDLVMADRETMRETRRGLFGFSGGNSGILAETKEADEIKELDSTVSSARQFGYGNWRITLADGSVWEQIDDAKLMFDPRPGNKVHIYKGMMGTFRANVDDQRAIKVRRVQ